MSGARRGAEHDDAPRTRGGIAAVIAAYRAAGLFERWPVEYVATHCEGSWPRKLLVAARALRRFAALLAAEPDTVVHVHCASRASFWRKCVFMAIAHAARCPVILHLHGGSFARFYERECGLLRRRIVRFFLERAACVIVLSERWRAWLTQVAALRHVVCIPNPVPIAPAPPPGGRRNVVLFLGRLTREKGLHELLEAFAGLRVQLPEAELVCAGAGELEAAQQRAARLGIEETVRFPGWIGPQERQAWLRRAAVLALPSHAEGLPMCLLEAMAAGVPVVASAVGGIPDVVRHGVNGLLVAPGDAAELERALRRLLREPRLAAALGAAGRESVRERNAPERVLAQLEGVYAGLGLEARPARARLRRVA